MSQITDDARAVMVHYYELFKERYHEHWKPSTEHVAETIELLRSSMPGIPGYTKEDLLARLDAFFRCKEDWLISCKYSYSIFVKYIHRWINAPAKVPLASPSAAGGTPSYKCDCGNELHLGEVCLKCFPICDNCGSQHSPRESCAEFAERDRKVRELFSKQQPRGGEIKTISGENAFE